MHAKTPKDVPYIKIADPPDAGKMLSGMLDITGRSYEKARDRDLA